MENGHEGQPQQPQAVAPIAQFGTGSPLKKVAIQIGIDHTGAPGIVVQGVDPATAMVLMLKMQQLLLDEIKFGPPEQASGGRVIPVHGNLPPHMQRKR